MKVVAAGITTTVTDATAHRSRRRRRPWRRTTALPVLLAAEKLHGLDNDFVLRSLLARGLIVPLVELQPTLNANLAALLEIFLDDFPRRSLLAAVDPLAVDEHGLFSPLSCLHFLLAVLHHKANLPALPAVGKTPTLGV